MCAAVESTIMACPTSAAGSPPADRSEARQIVLHADDLGMNAAVTQGILQAFEEGLVTSTSLLSNAPDAAQALDRWQQLESRRAQGSLASKVRRERLQDPAQPFDLGAHLNLTQGRPLTGPQFPAELLDENGCFLGVFRLFRQLRRSGKAVAAAIEAELNCQVQFMLDRGHRPTHLNGHQYIELLPVVDRIVDSLLDRFRIPVVRVACEASWWQSFLWPGISTSQWLVGGVKKFYASRFRRRMLSNKILFADVFFGTMTAGTTSLPMMRALLAAMRGFRLAEIGLHPGDTPGAEVKSPSGWYDPLAHLRPRELKLLVSAGLEELLAANRCRLGRLAQADLPQVIS
jgi:chitin disaccharide deacetylase